MANRDDIVLDYLLEKLTISEREAFEKELENSEELQQVLASYSNIWATSDKLSHATDHTDEAWSRFEAKVKAPRKSLSFDWLKVAASITILAALSLTFFLYLNKDQVTYTANTSSKTIYLEDQSSIVINEKSMIIEEDGFGIDNRNLELQGEAYFDVQKSNIPFKVDVANGQVIVLGTKFNILTSKVDKFTAIELYEGSVNFTDLNGKSKLLKPGQRLTVNNTEMFVQSIGFEKPLWSTAELIVCSNVSLQHIMVELKKQYQVDFNLNRKLLNEKYTVSLPKDNLQKCLKILSKISDKKFILKNNVITAQ